jgi:hypothetical protein
MSKHNSLLRQCIWLALMLPLALLSSAVLRGQDASPQDAKKEPAQGAPDLSVEQARLADRFKRLEQVIGRLAELSAGNDPRRAELLRQAIAQSREQDLNLRFESVVKLLEAERLAVAATNQTELQTELDALLNLLLKADRDTALASERERIREYLKELGRLLRLERDLRARTEGGDDERRLTEAQKKVADETGKLGGKIDETERENDPSGKKSELAGKNPSDGKAGKLGDAESKEAKEKNGKDPEGSPGDKDGKPGELGENENKEGKSVDGKSSDGKSSKNDPSKGQPSEKSSSPGQPSEGQPSEGKSGGDSKSDGKAEEQPQQPPPSPTDRATERLREAQQQMEEAIKKLEEASREGATERQQKAIESLEVAKAELERVLRQMREEEMERTLTQLAARFRKMLELQTVVYEGTMRIDKVPAADRNQDNEIEAARLSRQEATLEREADKALLLLREEGSSVAFPETVELLRDDMRQVTARLAKVDVGQVTQGLETDIIAALEETIAALEKALKDLEQNRAPPGGGAPPGGQPAEPPLVNKLAELKMIRSLQMRINLRTRRYGQMIEGEQANTPEILAALEDLAKRQARVYQATADLSQGRND